MPAAISNFVDVTVLLAAVQAERFAFGVLLGIFDHSATVNRQDGPFTSLAEVEAAGFTLIAEPEVHAWATAVFAQDDNIDEVIIGREDVGDLDWGATYAAVRDADPLSYYFVNIESRVDADILLVAAIIETERKVFIPQSSDADILTDGVGNIAEDLEVLGFNRTALMFHAIDDSLGGLVPSDGYLDGGWGSSGGGLNLDGPAGVGTWIYRQIEAVAFDAVTSTEAGNIYDNDANLFGRNLGLSFTSKGTMASGRFIDVQTSLDWTQIRLEEDILSLFVGAGTKIPYTNGGINIIAGGVQGVYDKGVNFGHYSPDELPTLTVPEVVTVSSAAKIARELTLSGNAILSGAIHKAIITINVQQ